MAMRQPGDDTLSCANLLQQRSANEADAAAMLRKQKQTNTGNVAAVVLLGILGAAAANFSESDKIQARALLDRNEQINYLLKKQGC